MKNPGIHIPPPLIYAAFFAAGYAMQRFVPLPFTSPELSVLGAVLALISIVIAALGFFEFYRSRTTVRPDRAASAFIARGIFNYSRNPLYLSMLFLYVGAGLWENLWWALVLLPLLLAIINIYVIRREERYLAERFGDEYRAYCARVGRWF